jgi:hypothetical protein
MPRLSLAVALAALLSSHIAHAQTRGPALRIAGVSATGALPRDVYRRVFTRNLSQLLYCYSDAVHENANAAGVLAIAVRIRPTGRAARVVATGSGHVSAALRRCAESVVDRWEFPIYSPPGDARGVVRIRLVRDAVLDRR